MSFFKNLSGRLPGAKSSVLAAGSSVLLAASFPDLGIAPLAWISFVPILIAIRFEKERSLAPFLTGWLFGTLFYFFTCWWLTFAPITYAGFPVIPTYFLLLAASAGAGCFAGIFGLIYGISRKAFGPSAPLLAPFIWTGCDFMRYWLTGNNWNAVGYSQAFNPGLIQNASLGGVNLTGFVVVLASSLVVFVLEFFVWNRSDMRNPLAPAMALILLLMGAASMAVPFYLTGPQASSGPVAEIVAVQPNVPMAGLDHSKWRALRKRQTDLAESALSKSNGTEVPVAVVLPESPMNYQYALDPEFRNYIDSFARRNDVSVLFNSAEPDPSRERGSFNSAVLVGTEGGKVTQYDKIHLLPFGEFVPLPEFAQHLIPPMVGRFSHGNEYDLFDIGGAKAGVMICFESHFGSLSAEYAARGADAIIEMTNDGYLGPTPVLRQHLSNAVFRAVETGLPVYRVTNVGVTARIDRHGRITDEADTYSEAVRRWEIRKSGDERTLYVLGGDLFSVFCLLMTAVIAVLAFRRRRHSSS